MYRRILVPLDGSRRAEAILPHVEALANCLGSEVLFLRVIDVVAAYADANELVPTQYLEGIHLAEDAARQYLDHVSADFNDKNIKSRTRMLYGSVVSLILDTARQEDVDLIAMASHGRSGVANLFYGSVALGVLHRADRPLLLVRSEHEE